MPTFFKTEKSRFPGPRQDWWITPPCWELISAVDARPNFGRLDGIRRNAMHIPSKTVGLTCRSLSPGSRNKEGHYRFFPHQTPLARGVAPPKFMCKQSTSLVEQASPRHHLTRRYSDSI